MRRYIAVLATTVCGCSWVNGPDAESVRLRYVIEPSAVQARFDFEQRIVVEFIVRTFNDGPGDVFMPHCGHEMQRAEPNGNWAPVFTVPCQQGSGPPFWVEPGGHFGYPVRIVAAADSEPWRSGGVAGRYRMLNYASDQAPRGGALGRLIAAQQRTTAEFTLSAPVPNEGR